MLRPALTVATQSGSTLIPIAQLRSEAGLGSLDASFDVALREVLTVAQEWVESYLEYSVLPVARTDYYREFQDVLALTQPADTSETLTVRAQGDSVFAELPAPITDFAAGQKVRYDVSAGGVLTLTEEGKIAADLLEPADAIVNPVSVWYTTIGPEDIASIRLAVKKLAISMYAQQASEPSELAKRTAQDILDRIHKTGGIAL